MIALLLALAWAPLVSHCQLESLSNLQFLRCETANQPAEPGSGHCSDTSCCAVESGHYLLPSHQLIVPVNAFAPVLSAAVEDVVRRLPPQVNLGELTAAPPELASGWQFRFRTAPPSRAPSRLA